MQVLRIPKLHTCANNYGHAKTVKFAPKRQCAPWNTNKEQVDVHLSRNYLIPDVKSAQAPFSC
jgi:hypothetical protein